MNSLKPLTDCQASSETFNKISAMAAGVDGTSVDNGRVVERSGHVIIEIMDELRTLCHHFWRQYGLHQC